jgi:hypothetical protein
MSLRYGGSCTPESAPAKTVHLAAGRSRDVHPAVIALQPEGSRTPLFCVDAGPLWLPLSKRLYPDRPVLGLRVPVSEAGRFQVPFRIEDGAAELVRYLREIQATGPYYLAGLCIDGVVAYEMARQLVAQGHEVAMLALLDAPSPFPRHLPLAESGARIPSTKLEMLWNELLQGGIKGTPGFVYRRCKAFARQLKLLRWRVQQSMGLKVKVDKLLNDPDVVEDGKFIGSAAAICPCSTKKTLALSPTSCEPACPTIWKRKQLRSKKTPTKSQSIFIPASG